MAVLKEKESTIADIYALPDGKRAELIDGQIYDMTPPNRLHQKIVTKLGRVIGNYIEENQGNCEVYLAPFAVRLNEDDRTYVEPDISVICDPGRLDDRGCNGAPDWVIEVVSPGSRRMDYMTKLFKYRTAGVREYWIIDPAQERVQVYSFDEPEEFMLYSFDEDVAVGIYEGLSVNIAEMLRK